MLIHILALGLLLCILLVIGGRRLPSPVLIRVVTGGLLTLNSLIVIGSLVIALLLWLDEPLLAQAAPLFQEGGGAQDAGGEGMGNTALGAALATGLAAIGAGIAVGISGAAAIGAITEKPEVLGRTLIFVGLAEGIAIYGLIISFLILTGGLGG